MTTNTPEAWEERFDKRYGHPATRVFDEVNEDWIPGDIKDFIRSLLHTTKVELLREVMAEATRPRHYCNCDRCHGGEVYAALSSIRSLASRYGITEEELNDKK